MEGDGGSTSLLQYLPARGGVNEPRLAAALLRLAIKIKIKLNKHSSFGPSEEEEEKRKQNGG